MVQLGSTSASRENTGPSPVRKSIATRLLIFPWPNRVAVALSRLDLRGTLRQGNIDGGVGREALEVELFARGRLQGRDARLPASVGFDMLDAQGRRDGEADRARTVNDVLKVDARQLPRSGRRERGDRPQPQRHGALGWRRRKSNRHLPRLVAAICDGLPRERNVARRNLDQFQRRIEGQRDLWQRLAMGVDFQIDREIDAAERKVVGRRLTGQNGLRTGFFAPGLGQSQPATGPASHLEPIAMETWICRAFIGDDPIIDCRRQFAGQFDPQPIHGTRRQGNAEAHATRGIPLPGKRPVELHLPRALGQDLHLAVGGHSKLGRGAVGRHPLGPGNRQIARVQGHEQGAFDRLRDVQRGTALQQGLAVEPRVVFAPQRCPRKSAPAPRVVR